MSAKERFESWAGYSINLSKDSDGEYWLTSTRTAWLAWQEAERQMIETMALAVRTAVREDDFTDDADHDSGILDGLRIAERAIRAIGAEDD